MNKAMMLALAGVALVPAAQASHAAPAATAASQDAGVPVFPYDITDRPYKVLGEVKAGVRKATVFSGEPSQVKIYRELWERAEKLGADAVIKAQYGDAHVTAFSWGKTNATGVAIKFTGEAAPAAAPAPAEPSATAPEPAPAPETPGR